MIMKLKSIKQNNCVVLINREPFQVALVVKNPPDNAGDIRNASLIPGSRRSPGRSEATHSSILAWNIPWTRGAWQTLLGHRVRQD